MGLCWYQLDIVHTYKIFLTNGVLHQVDKFVILQEYFIRHIDGYTVNTEGEKEHVVKCLEAAIERRVCEVNKDMQQARMH